MSQPSRRGGLLGLLGLLIPLSCTPPAAPPSATAPPPPPAAPAQQCPAPPDPDTSPVFLRQQGNYLPRQLSFSPDGSRLAVVDYANKVQVRDARNGQLLAEMDTLDPEPSWDGTRTPQRIDWGTSDRLGVFYLNKLFVWDLRPAPADARPGALVADGSVITVNSGEATMHRGDPESELDRNAVSLAPPPGTAAPPRGVRATPPPPGLATFWPLALGVASISGGTLTARAPRTLAPTSTHELSPGTTHEPIGSEQTSANTVFLSPDRRTVILEQESWIRLIDVATGKIVLELGQPSPGHPIRSAEYSRRTFDARHNQLAFALGPANHTAELLFLDLTNRSLINRMTGKKEETLWVADFSEDGSSYCVFRSNSSCFEWDIRSGKKLGERTRTRQKPRPNEIFGPGYRLSSRLDSWRITVRDEVSGQKLWSLPSNSGPAKLLGAVTSPDGDRLALIPDGKSRKFLQLRPGEARVSVALPQEDDSLTGVAFGPPGSTFAAFGRKSGVTFYTPDTLEPWGTEGTGRGVQAARWSPNGLLLATADLDGNVTLWTDRTPRTIQLPGIAASELRFSDDSLYLVAAGRDGSLLAWSTATADPIGPWHLGLGARAELTLSREKAPSHEIMAHSPAAGALSFYNLETGATRQEPDCLPTEHATSLGLSARGHSLLLAAGQGPAALCDLTSGKLVARLAPGEATPQSAASYDLWGQRVATVAAEGEGSVVRVRETATGQVLFVLPFPDNRPASLRLLFTASGLVVSREEGASFHPLKDCSALDLRLVEQNNVLGWLATDRAGRFDGDSPGRMLAWVRGPGGRLVERPERDKHRVPGLMLGVRPASPPPRSQPSEDED